jgi:hypothetical protein
MNHEEKMNHVMKNAKKYIKSLYPDSDIQAYISSDISISICVYESGALGNKELKRFIIFEDGSMNEILGKKYR